MAKHDTGSTDWSALGLKVGIEIHQQLDTGKLFCDCPSELVDEDGPEVRRCLRPTQSEMGEIDKASLLEARKDLQFVYQNPPTSTCLVEIDEEPPHDLDTEALFAAMTVCKLLGARLVDEIHVMRKIVIDGSNTAGFQRTALIATDGTVPTSIGDVPLDLICLEEDSARKVETRPGQVVYKIDRLGIPLVEIATGPVMRTPGQVRDVAETIGMALRATKMVKRGLGTIRQDLNVSITGGARVEIKGVQELNAIPEIVEDEVDRQQTLIDIKGGLSRRGVGKKDLPRGPTDVTDHFKDTKSKVIRSALKKKGKVLGVKLPGFKGLLGKNRLGAELAAYAKTAGVRGIFHTDELPGYGLGQDEVDAVSRALGLKGKHDAFAIVAEKDDIASVAMEQVLARAAMAFDGVPSEVRGVRELARKGKDDLFTEFQRPMPGAARMYPETDIPPVRMTDEMVENVPMPEMPMERISRFVEEFGLSKEQAKQLVYGDMDELFEQLGHGFPDLTAVVARTLLNTLPELEDDGIFVKDTGILVLIIGALDAGQIAKEGVPEVLRKMVRDGVELPRALEELGLGRGPDMEEVRQRVRSVVHDRGDIVKKKGLGAMGPMMGELMAIFRGKVDGKVVSDILKDEITKFVQS